MTSLIEIRPVVPRRGNLYERQFVDAGTAAEFMIGKDWSGWKLYIRGRFYNWPTEHGLLIRRIITDHIIHCLELDEAFYG
jgi:hypothetical protein